MTAAESGRALRLVLGIAALAFAHRATPARADDAVPPADRPIDPGGNRPGGNRRVALDVFACPTDVASAVRRIVVVEIGDLLVESGQPISSDDDRLSIVCEGSLVRIATDGSQPRARVERTLSLTDFPADAAPRALALAGIEALATLSPAVRLRIEARARRPAKSGASPLADVLVNPPSKPLATLHEAPPPPRPSLTITVSGIWRWFPATNGISAWGRRVAVDRSLGTRFNLGLDLDLVEVNRQLPAGDVDGLLISGGALWGLRGQWPRFMGNLGVGARGGVARLVGHPTDVATVQGASAILPWGGPIVSGRMLAGRGPLIASATLEIGMTLLEAKGTANGDTALAIRGVWLSIGIGAGIRL